MDDRYPDSTFVEDAAVIIGQTAVLTRPGAASRAGEVAALAPALRSAVRHVLEITAPGTLDGGDVCEAEGHYLIGVSQRTNEEGARQLAEIIQQAGLTSSLVDIRRRRNILHLKSGIGYLGDRNMVAWEELADLEELCGYNLLRVGPGEHYAANCVRVNDRVLVADGFAPFRRRLEDAGYDPLVLDVSEFRKMDGGLSCLSIRF
jgi:dimethylargininase